MKKEMKKLAIYQAKDGSIELKLDNKKETFWANLDQIAMLFGRDKSVVSRHIKNIFKDEELDKKVVHAKFAHTTKHGAIKGKTQTKDVDFYNLDIILAVGYRTNSSKAIEFRKWATKTLKQYIEKGFTINPKQIEHNYQEFLKTVEDIKLLTKDKTQISNLAVLELVKAFSATWFSLESYDKQNFPKESISKKVVQIQAKDLYKAIAELKQELIKKGEATEFFAQEKTKGNLEGILGNIFQTVFGEDAYLSIEEKAVHLLYFIIKNHPFTDGNKRTGAFAFIWFLQKSKISFEEKITPETLTALALLVAESDPKEKEKIVGLLRLLLLDKK